MDQSKLRELLQTQQYDALLDVIETQSYDAKVHRSEIELLRIEALMGGGEFEVALNSVKQYLTDASEVQEGKIYQFRAMVIKLRLLIRIGQLKLAHEEMQKADTLYGELLNEANPAALLEEEGLKFKNTKGQILGYRGDLVGSRQFFNEVLTVRRQQSDKRAIATIQNNLGLIYIYNGKPDEALDLFLSNADLFEELEDEYRVIVTQNNLSLVHGMKGNYQQSILYAKKVLDHEITQSDSQIRLSALNLVGAGYHTLGDLDLATIYYNQCFQLAEEVNNAHQMIYSLGNLGGIYFDKNDFETALNYYQQSRRIANEQNVALMEANILFSMIFLYMEDGNKDLAQELYSEMLELQQEQNTPLINQCEEFARAILLRMENRISDKVKAIDLLKKVSQEGINHELEVVALLQLANLYLYELKVTQNEEILADIFMVFDKLNEIALSKNMETVRIEVYIIQSKLEMLRKDFRQAKHFLEKANELSMRWGYLRFHVNASAYHDLLLPYLDERNRLLDQQVTVDERTIYRELEDLISTGKQFKLLDYDIERENPLALLVFTPQMQLVYRYDFTTHLPEEFKGDFVGQIVSTVESFKHGKYYNPDVVERISFDNHVLLFRMIAGVSFCYLIRGKSFSAFHRLDSFIEFIVKDTDYPVSFSQLKNSRLETSSSLVLDKLVEILFLGEGDEDPFSQLAMTKHTKRQILENPEQMDQISNFDDFETIIHPTRLSIMRYLNSYIQLPRSDLIKLLNITSGALERHLTHLENNGVIENAYEFIDNKPRKVIFITQKGLNLFHVFKQNLGVI